MTIALNIPASLLPFMLRLMILSSNHLLYASLATSTLTPSGKSMQVTCYYIVDEMIWLNFMPSSLFSVGL